MSAVLLDTQALFWLLAGHPKLGRKAKRLAERARRDSELCVCAVSYWEAAHFLEENATQSSLSVGQLRSAATGAGIHEVALDGAMALRAYELLPVHRDPMDRFILAAAEARQATLITADHDLIKWRGSIKRFDAQE